jgi:flagellar export protein FliJ
MPTFKFRLEKVWKHRRKIVDEHSIAVAGADKKVAALAKQIVELGKNIDRQSRSMLPREGKTLHARDLIAGTTWLQHLHHLNEDLDLQLQRAVKDLEHHRSRLTDSWRDLEVLSKLRDRQAENWQTRQDRRERKEMDEIGQFRAFRHGVTKVSR